MICRGEHRGQITFLAILQRMHLWVWLNEPQHSAAVQALAAIIFGLMTFLVGFNSLRYLNAATLAAQKQAEAASRQTDILQQQIAADAERIAQERQRRLATLKTEYESQVAKDDACRPMFRSSGFTSARSQTMDFVNSGVDAAVDVKVSDDNGEIIARFASVHPNGSLTVRVDIEKLATIGYLFLFRSSSSGTSWTIRVRGAGTTLPVDEVLSADRPYSIRAE